MNKFYRIDSTSVSHLEFLWWHKSPMVMFSWMQKWLRIPGPCSSDDPNTETTLTFIVENLPPEITHGFVSLADEFAGLGFFDPVFHAINDSGTRTTIYWATFRHESGNYFARIHQRLWQQAANPNRALFPMFFTAFADGTFLVSSAGKPDMAAPATIKMNRLSKAMTVRLWEKHRQLSDQLAGVKIIAPVNSREEVVMVTEQHHILLRDFHLARGVFRERTGEEQGKADDFAASVARAQADGLEHAEVLAELEKLQEKKSSWRASLWVLAGSFALFLALGVARWNWQLTLWLIPVLLFHESGHWVAMRVFHYRNLRMFFIPLFGAAVMGQNWNVPGWKKALVSLAGPLPGIALGVFLGVLGLLSHKDWLDHAALMLLFINGFNLLPFLPLDGGHVLLTTLFCRNRWMDVTFRLLAVVGLLSLNVLGLGRFFLWLAILMAVNLPMAFKLARVTDALRKAELPPPLPGEDRIPVATAQAIISAVKAALPKAASNRSLAQHTVNIFETLNARPPGVLGTIGLLALHAGAFLVAITFSLLLLINRNSSLGDFFRAAANQPHHVFQCGNWQKWEGAAAQKNPAEAKNLLVATFTGHAQAEAAFASLTNQTPANSGVIWFGDSVLLTLPATDDAARNREFDQLQMLTTNVFVAPSNQPVVVSFSFIAPTQTAATNAVRDLENYFEAGAGLHLIPPWSPLAVSRDFPAQNQARQEWRRISDELSGSWEDSALRAISDKIRMAVKRGDETEQNRLNAEFKRLHTEIEGQRREALRTNPTNPVPADLLDLQARLSALDYTNKTARAAILRELALKLGQVKLVADAPAPGAEDYGAISGMVSRHGLLIEASWVQLNDAATGLPALADWLCHQDCKTIRYDFAGSFAAGLDD